MSIDEIFFVKYPTNPFFFGNYYRMQFNRLTFILIYNINAPRDMTKDFGIIKSGNDVRNDIIAIFLLFPKLISEEMGIWLL